MYVMCIRSLVRLAPIRPQLRFGTALIAHHRTGLIPAHSCTGTKSTPHPTSATGPRRSLAHMCTASESIPRRHLRHHCCPLGHLPLRNTSVAHQRSPMCCNHMHCVATECHLCTIDPAADGTCSNRLHAAALPCDWLHPIQSKQAKRRRRWPNRVACARALWTRILRQRAVPWLPRVFHGSAGRARATGGEDSVDVRVARFGSE